MTPEAWSAYKLGRPYGLPPRGNRRLIPPVGTMLPERVEAVPKCLGRFGEQPSGEAFCACNVGGLALRNGGCELRMPAGEGLMRFSHMP